MKDSLDLRTSSGRPTTNVLATIAQVATELRSGAVAARASGKRRGGRKQGTRVRVTVEKEKAGESISVIARNLDLSRTTVYKVCA